MRGVQTYKYKECNKKFSAKRRNKTILQKKIWKDYVFGKQTIRELSRDYEVDKRIVKEYLNTYTVPTKTHFPRTINLVVDGTYFGERKEQTSWCLVVFRDPRNKENLWWTFTKAETISVYREGRDYLESLGYTIKSVTGDGFGGIRQAFSCTPFQMCHVHMERLVIKGTTRNPQTKAGVVLLSLVRTLKDTDQETFRNRSKQFIEIYRDFLNEETIHPLSEESSYKHDGVRSALKSLVRFEPFLFTFKQNKKISRTTNSIEGHFSNINRVTSIHRGLSKLQKQKVLHSILLASSVAPTEEKFKYVL
ncbi:MAG: hypothetical protein ACI8V7_000362 [Candidatus Paceibacteria bacterium]